MSNRHLPKYKQAGYPTAWAFKQEVKRRLFEEKQQQEQIAIEMGVTPQYISKIAKELKRRYHASLEPNLDPARSETSPPEVRDTDEPGEELGSPQVE